MKRILYTAALLTALAFSGCVSVIEPVSDSVSNVTEQSVQRLVDGNIEYIDSVNNQADISKSRRENTAENGQSPYAVIVTCSDSRVPPEHIFSAGIGDLFVIRTAGNVVSDFDLGSIEYGVAHLGASVVVVMGHSYCGAVSAAMDGRAEGYIAGIVDEINRAIEGTTERAQAENLNIIHSYNKIMESEIVSELAELGEIIVVMAKYDIHTGAVAFIVNDIKVP